MANVTEIATGLGVGLYGLYQIYVFLHTKLKLPISKQTDFTTHRFFMFMDDAVNYAIPNFKINNNPEKSDVVRIYADIKFKAFRAEMLRIVSQFKETKGAHGFSEKDLLDSFTKTVNLYRETAKIAITKKYSQGVADIFDDKFTNEVHASCISTIKYCITNICHSSFYSTCAEKLSAILDLYTFAFQLTMFDLEITCSKLNGNLSLEFEKLGYTPKERIFVTREEFEMSEKVQNLMIKDLNNA